MRGEEEMGRGGSMVSFPTSNEKCHNRTKGLNEGKKRKE